MKKICLSLLASLVFMSTLLAQITQTEADEIIQQRLESDTRPCTVYAKECVQSQGITIATATGDALELGYSCWVYYVDYTEETYGKYLIVKESNGNLLAINPKNDTAPNDLATWRIVIFESEYPIDIPFTEYSLEETSCQWVNLDYSYYNFDLIIVNNAEELENYIVCTEGSYPEIDFSEYTLLLAYGVEGHLVIPEFRSFQQLSEQSYVMNVNLHPYDASVITEWQVAIIVDKIAGNAHIELIVTKR